MLISLNEFTEWSAGMKNLESCHIGFDFETTGLNPYKDKAFLMGFTDPKGAKFSVSLSTGSDQLDLQLCGAMHDFFSNAKVRYCAHNAKFELGFLSSQFGVEVKGQVWDTEVHARIECNHPMSYGLQDMSYGLQACAMRIGDSKYKPMLEWLKQRGNKGMYSKAPLGIIIPYCEHDAWLSWRLCEMQLETFKHWEVSSPSKIKYVVNLENAVLSPLFEMEKQGLLVDVGYCKRAAEYEKESIEKAKARFKALTSVEFIESRKTLQPIFDAHGIRYGTTAIGNASFTEGNLLSSQGHPVVAALLEIRRATKRLSAYWENFLELEHNGIIHPSINQNRAQTGRMSISDPSCQNWSTDEDENTPFPIRRAFVAREGCVVASLDYSQMELRKSADEADDFPMIERIRGGADLHQEVADMAGVPRSLAKNGRFAKQYGAGVKRIAETLGVDLSVAQKISDAIDEQAKAVAAYSRHLMQTCKPFGTDWLGRRFYFDRGFEYKAFNYRIQGGCAEILKIAICSIEQFLKQCARPETFMLLPIHDEVVINMHESDLHLLPTIKRLMIAAHRDKKHLEMDVSIAVGPNFHDLEEWNEKNHHPELS